MVHEGQGWPPIAGCLRPGCRLAAPGSIIGFPRSRSHSASTPGARGATGTQPADGLDPYRLAAQTQVIRVVAMVVARAGESRFDHEIAESFRQAMEPSGWRGSRRQIASATRPYGENRAGRRGGVEKFGAPSRTAADFFRCGTRLSEPRPYVGIQQSKGLALDPPAVPSPLSPATTDDAFAPRAAGQVVSRAISRRPERKISRCSGLR
jgi:hypothetical protein